MAAAAGDITGWPLDRFTLQSRLRALVFAADHQRLESQRESSVAHREVEAILRQLTRGDTPGDRA
jgi:hypothetical protein